MKKLISSLLIVSQLALVGSVASAQTLPDPPQASPGEPDVGAVIYPIKKGWIAPFTGTLLSPLATANIIAEFESLKEQIALEVNRTKAEEEAKCELRVSEVRTSMEANRREFEVRLEAKDKEIVILNDIIKQQEDDRPNMPLWIGVSGGAGFILGAGLTVLAAYVTNRVAL